MMNNIFSNKTVLIVDDFESFRNSLKKMVKSLGADKIDTAKNGMETIKMCESHFFDIILMDNNLGEGKNGQQVLEELKELKLLKHTSIFIMITAEIDKDMVLGAIEHKPDDYIAKPFPANLLADRLKKALSKKAALGELFEALDKEDLTAAIKFCDEHIKERGRFSAWCLQSKANYLLELERLEEAQDIYMQILQKRKVAWALLGLGKSYEKQCKYEEAIETLISLTEVNPMCLEAWDTLAKLYVKVDKPDMAEKVLSEAIDISAKSPARLKMVADLHWQNNHLDDAIKVYRQTMNEAKHSIHNKPEIGLDLARCITETIADLDGVNDVDKVTHEALQVLDDLSEDFDSEKVKLESKLIETRVYSASHQDEKAKEAMDVAIKLKDKLSHRLDDNLSDDVQLELAKTYLEMNQEDKAQKILEGLAEKATGDPKICAQIDKLVAAPLSEKGKQQVFEINKIGIESFKERKYREAIKYFSKAVVSYPKNVGLRLNLAQSLLGELSQTKAPETILKRAQREMGDLSQLTDDHEEYGRYQQLLQNLTSAEAKFRNNDNLLSGDKRETRH